MSILIVGSVAFDKIKTPFAKSGVVLGGSATYSSISASYFNSVNLVGVVGGDFPKKYLTLLNKKNIDIKGLSAKTGKTFMWEGEYGWDFSNPKTLATHLGVFSTFKPQIPRDYRNSRYIFLANIDPCIQLDVLGQIKRPKLVVCDTMNYWIENKLKDFKKVLRRVDIFLLNESESRELTGCANLIKAGKQILSLGPKVVVIKKGEHGVLLFTKKHLFATPAYLLEEVFDPTGAGDTFAGGFIGYLSNCQRYNQTALRGAAIYGSIMATFAVESFSVDKLTSINKRDIEKRIIKFKKTISIK